MKDSFKFFLETLKDALGHIGMSNDILDHGSAEEAEAVYKQAQQTIRKAFEEASPEDRELFHLLFGSNMEFDRISWSNPFDYIAVLLDRNPEIPLERLRVRIPHFFESVEALKSSATAITETIAVRYTKQECVPSLLEGFLRLVTRQSGPPGCYYEMKDGFFTSFHFTLEGDGFTTQTGNKAFEYNVLLHGVWIHCLHLMQDRQEEIKLVFEDRASSRKIKQALVEEFKKASWDVVA